MNLAKSRQAGRGAENSAKSPSALVGRGSKFGQVPKRAFPGILLFIRKRVS